MRSVIARTVFYTSCAILLGALAAVWYEAHSDPFTCDDAANTCTYRIAGTEPSKTVGGATLTNLKQVNLKTQVNSGAWATIVKVATAPGGGGAFTQDITFATVPCALTTLNVKASATNTANLEGPEAPATGSPVKRDRTTDPTCAPAAPPVLNVS